MTGFAKTAVDAQVPQARYPSLDGPLSSTLPLRLPCGFVLEEISDSCYGCKTHIPMDHWVAIGSWISENAFSMHMRSEYPHCEKINDLKFRVRGQPDKSADFDMDVGGKWVTRRASNQA